MAPEMQYRVKTPKGSDLPNFFSLHHKNSTALHPIAKHVVSRPKYFGSTEENYQHAPSTANEVILNIKKELV